MKNVVTLTTTTAQKITNCQRPNRNILDWRGTVLVWGNFGSSGAIALYLSPDNGTTLIPLTASAGGTAISFTAQGMTGVDTGFTCKNTDVPLELWAQVTAGTGYNINVACYDNQG